jgi:RNA polymerase sigma-B factor
MSARSIAPAGDDSARSDREVARELFGRFAGLADDDPSRQRVRDRLVEMHLPLVEYLARRFAGRGEPLDDLVQVGTIGLIKAVDRFDTERGV